MTHTVTVTCFEWDELVDLVVDPDVHGCALIEQDEDGWGRVGCAVRPGLQPDLFDMVIDWAVSRIDRFIQHGADPDGWQQRSDGAWQIWARLHEMPSLD